MNLITSMYIFIFFLLIVQTGSENPHTRSPSGQNTSRQGEGNSTTDASIIVSTHNAPDDGSTTTHPPNAVATSNVIQNSTANQPLSADASIIVSTHNAPDDGSTTTHPPNAVATSNVIQNSTANQPLSAVSTTAAGLGSTATSSNSSSVNTSPSLGSTVISYTSSSASPTSTVSTTAAGLGSTATSSNSYSASPTSTVNISASLGSTVISYTNSSVPSLTCFNVTSNNQGKSLEYHALRNICELIQSCLTGNVLFYVILPTSEDGTGKAKSSSSISNSLVIIVKVNETCPVSLPANFTNPPINIGRCLDSNYSLQFEDYPLKDVKTVTCNHNGSTNDDSYSTDVTTTAPAATGTPQPSRSSPLTNVTYTSWYSRTFGMEGTPQPSRSSPLTNVTYTSWYSRTFGMEVTPQPSGSSPLTNVTYTSWHPSTIGMEGNHTNSSAATQAVKEGVQELMLVLNSSNVTDARLAAVFSRISDSLPLADVDLDLASQLINAISQLLNSSHNLSSHTKRMIIHLVDTLGLRLTFKEESANVTSPLLALAVVKVNTSNFKETSFGIGTGSNLQVSLGNETSQSNLGVVHLPSSLLSTLSAENQAQASRIQFNFYSNTLLFQDGQNGRKLNSHVISASVANLSISNLKDKINITLPNLKQGTVNESAHCAFWNFSKHGGNGSWDTGGCIAIQEQDNKTVCSCDHLTSFGVLVIISQPEHSPVHLLILTYITYVGCGLSSIFLAVTLVTYIAFEKIRKDYPSKILIHLCTALLLLNLFFLIDGWIYYFGPNACIAIAVLLHYFLLVSFTWMGLEAFHMYLALVKVFNTYMRKYILKFSLIGWGVPAVVVAIVVGINGGGNYGIVSYGRFPDNATDNFCWLKNDIAFYISVVGYFSLMALLNTSMFIVVLIQLCRIKKRNPSGENQRSLIQEIRSVSGLTVLLGITWGFAFFAWGPVNLAFMYLFAIFNTLQGLFIFIFHCAAKDTVRKQWRRYLCCGKLRLAENSDWSKTATSKKVPPVAAGGADTGSTNSLQSNSLSNCSSTLLMNKSYSDHSNGIVNFKRNKGSYDIENGGVYLDDIIVNKFAQDAEKDADYKKTSIAQRRTSQKRGSLPF